MREPSELEKLNAVAQARSERASVPQILLSFWVMGYSAWAVFDWGAWGRRPVTWLRCGFSLLMFASAISMAIELIRVFRAIRRAKSPACWSERRNIERWVGILRSEAASPGIVQFAAGDFWTDGRLLVRILQEDDWIVVANFHRQNLSKNPRLTIFGRSETPVVYSQEQRRLRIGKLKFRKVEFSPDSMERVNQFAQVVGTV